MNKKISLYINTSETKPIILVLFSHSKKTIKKFSIKKEYLSQKLLLLIDHFLKDNHQSFKNLHNIIIYSGPGSYTSLRIGISVANALAFGLDIPVYSFKKQEKLETLLTKITKNNIQNFSKPASVFYQQHI